MRDEALETAGPWTLLASVVARGAYVCGDRAGALVTGVVGLRHDIVEPDIEQIDNRAEGCVSERASKQLQDELSNANAPMCAHRDRRGLIGPAATVVAAMGA